MSTQTERSLCWGFSLKFVKFSCFDENIIQNGCQTHTHTHLKWNRPSNVRFNSIYMRVTLSFDWRTKCCALDFIDAHTNTLPCDIFIVLLFLLFFFLLILSSNERFLSTWCFTTVSTELMTKIRIYKFDKRIFHFFYFLVFGFFFFVGLFSVYFNYFQLFWIYSRQMD